MLVAPTPFMTPSMIFSSKVLSSSSSSPARAETTINKPTPSTTADSRKAFDELRIIQPPVPVLRIALPVFQN